MRKIIVLSLIGGVVLATLTGVMAQNPVENSPANGIPTKGRVVILDNERTLTGEVERVGELYRIKRLVGEMSVPATSVVMVCNTLEEAYHFLRRRANLNDASERLRLVEWCRQHGLREQALAEARAAATLRPKEERIARLVRFLEQSPATPKTVSPPPPDPPVPHIDVTSESMGIFSSRIQPILQNTCISCHAGNRGGSFQLTRVYGPGNRKALERNLATVLSHVNPNHPAASRLLQKAISIHGPGMAQAPIKNRQAAAYQTLEQWVIQTIENNPHLRLQASIAPTSLNIPTPVSQKESSWGIEATKQPDIGNKASTAPAALPPLPGNLPAVKPASRPTNDDPVDPDSFNREFHGRTRATEKPAATTGKDDDKPSPRP